MVVYQRSNRRAATFRGLSSLSGRLPKNILSIGSKFFAIKEIILHLDLFVLSCCRFHHPFMDLSCQKDHPMVPNTPHCPLSFPHFFAPHAWVPGSHRIFKHVLPCQDPYVCWSASVHYKYIETPLYIAQNVFDQNQIGSILGVDWWPFKNATIGLTRILVMIICSNLI